MFMHVKKQVLPQPYSSAVFHVWLFLFVKYVILQVIMLSTLDQIHIAACIIVTAMNFNTGS